MYEDPAEVKLKHSPVPKSQPESSKTTDEIQLINARTTHHYQDFQKVAKTG